MISKETFVDAMKSLEKVHEFYDDMDEICRQYDFGYGDCFTDSFGVVSDAMINILMDEFDDDEEHPMISWWVYDCDFGKEATMVIVEDNTDGLNEKWNVSTPEALYDFLVMCKERKNND